MREERAKISLLIVMALLIISFNPIVGSGQATVSDFSVFIPGEAERLDNGVPIIVRGLIHNFSFDISEFTEKISLKMYYGDVPDETTNDTGNYEWSYDPATGEWSDALYGRFIDTAECNAGEGYVSFHVGLSTTATIGLWNIEMAEGGEIIWNSSIYVEDYVIGLALQSVNTVFTVNPFSSETQQSQYHYRVDNKGNIPLKLTVIFDKYPALFSVTNMSEPLHVGEKRDFYVSLNSIPWSPRIVNVTGTVHPEVPQYLISNGTIALSTVADQTFNIQIQVVRQGYTFTEIGNIAFQYKDSIAATYGEPLTVDLYLTSINGTGTGQLEITADSLDIKTVLVNGKETESTITLQLSNQSENHVQITVEPTTPSITAYLNYDIRDSDSGERSVLKTEVVVGMGIAEDNESGSAALILLFIILGAFALSIIFITARHIKKGKNPDEGRKKSSRKRKRK